MKGAGGVQRGCRKGFTSSISAMLLLSVSVMLLMLIMDVEGRVDRENMDLQRLGVIGSIDTNIGMMATDMYARSGFPASASGNTVSIGEQRVISGRLAQNLAAMEAWWNANRRAEISMDVAGEANIPVFYIMPQGISVEAAAERTAVAPMEMGGESGVLAYAVEGGAVCTNLSGEWNNISFGTEPGDTLNFTINFTCGELSFSDSVGLDKYGYSELAVGEGPYNPILVISFSPGARMEVLKERQPNYLNMVITTNGTARVEIPGSLNISIGGARKDGRVVLR
jgi:hypothetical protein